MAKGNAGKGRKAGVRNKKSQQAIDILASMNCDPITGLANIALDNVLCSVCRGKGKTKFQPAARKATAKCQTCMGAGYRVVGGSMDSCPLNVPCANCGGTGWLGEATEQKSGERTCQSCWGSKLEKISPELKHAAYKELAKYTYPQLKQIEHSGPGGEEIPVRHVIVFGRGPSNTCAD